MVLLVHGVTKAFGSKLPLVSHVAKHIDMKNCYPEPPHNTNSYIMDLHETGEKCPSPTEHMCELQDAELESNTSDIELNNHDGRDGDDFIELIPFSTFSVWNGDGDALFE